MEIQALIDKINALLQEYAGYQPMPIERQEKLNKKFRLEFNYNSNHIEGNTLTYGETELYLIFDKTTGDHSGREYEEMKASDAALKKIQEQAQDKEQPLTEYFIKSLHELILVRPYWADAITPSGQHTRRQIQVGQYKSQPNSVRLQNGEMFHYASPEETAAQMGDLVQWYRDELEKNELHPVALAALLHYKFVRIHPFDDGNGRMSRLLMNYVLFANDMPPVIVKSADKKNYLAALNKADVGDINAFIEYIAEQLVWSLETSIKAAKGNSIEEQGDLEKEITVWKKGLLSDYLAKSAFVLNRLFFEQIQPFVELFRQKMDVFSDLFERCDHIATINSNISAYEGKNLILSRFFSADYSESKTEKGSIESIRKISIALVMQDFKIKKQYDKFVPVWLEFSFEKTEYIITTHFSDDDSTFHHYKIAYNDTLSENKQTIIIDTLLRAIFLFLQNISS